MEEEDLSHSEPSIRLSALQMDDGDASPSKPSTSTTNLAEKDEEDPFATSAGPKDAKTFNELFGAAYDAHLASLGVKEDEDGSQSYKEREIAHFVRGVERGSSLAASESAFANLFKLQTQIGGDNLLAHSMALGGWKAMLSTYIRRGSVEQLLYFMDTFEAMYGLHSRDRALILLKYRCQRQHLSDVREQFQQIVDEGEADDRIYATVATAFARRQKYESAFKYLDNAWMKALADPQFKITPVFYRNAAEIYIRALDLSRLSDLLIRLNANKPSVDAHFFYTMFRTINSRLGKIHQQIQDKRSDADASFKPSTSYQEDSLDVAKREMAQKDKEELAEAKNTETASTLKAMYALVEKSMTKHAIHPTTELRNEMIAFKLYVEFDVQAMLSVISTYSTKPDTTTLNLILDALLHDNKISLASTIFEAWDAQFGVKPNQATNEVISRYLSLYVRSLESNYQKMVSLPLELVRSSVETRNGIPKLNSLYRGLKHPSLDLFDEMIVHRPAIALNATALKDLSRVLRQLDGAEDSDTFAGLRILTSFFTNRTGPITPTEGKSIYDFASLLHSADQWELARKVSAFALKRGLPPHNLASIASLDIIHYHDHVSYLEFQSIWQQAVSVAKADQHDLSLRAYLRALRHTDLRQATPSKDALAIASAVSEGKTLFNEQVLQITLRLLISLSTISKLASNTLIFNLERHRRSKGIPLSVICATLWSNLLIWRIRFSLYQNLELAEQLVQRLETFADRDSRMGRFVTVLDDDRQREFEQLMEEIEAAAPADIVLLKPRRRQTVKDTL